MLLKIKQLIIENEGYKRRITARNIFVNSANIVSISDYHGATDFLLTEESTFSKEQFSLVKVSQGASATEIIAFGTAESIHSEINESLTKKELLHG